MKTTRIIFSLPAALTKKLKPFFDEATAKKGTTSLVVQIFDGAAKGLYLGQNDAPAARKILTKLWDTAEPIKFI